MPLWPKALRTMEKKASASTGGGYFVLDEEGVAGEVVLVGEVGRTGELGDILALGKAGESSLAPPKSQ